MGGRMRFALFAGAIVILSLVACNGSDRSTSEPGPAGTPAETSEATNPTPTSAQPTQQSPDNTFIETAEYTGVIISENGASEFDYLFGRASTEFWEPSTDDIAGAEACVREFLVTLQDNQQLDTYQQENLAFIVENLRAYRRQYLGIVVDGEKRIWINAFFSDTSFPDWGRVPVDVDGGGRNYWQIEYDLLNDECINFYVHGES
jgi:hypothetical protein